jgi:hypothetical protein
MAADRSIKRQIPLDMVKAAKGLQVLYPKMIHATCLAHAIYIRRCEQLD